jgi:RES domain
MSRNAVPHSPNPFPDDVRTIALPSGTALHRIYPTDYAGNAFNPEHKKLNRFSPIFDARGEIVPVLYAASSRAGAVYETLFHDAAIRGSRYKSLPLKSLNKHYGTWVTQRALRLATLHAPDLAKYGLTIDQLTATNAMYYPLTARWAEALHRANPAVEGLEWTSYRAGPERAYVFFGDRVKSSVLASAGDEVLITRDAALYHEVIQCGLRCGVRVHRPKLP